MRIGDQALSRSVWRPAQDGGRDLMLSFDSDINCEGRNG